MTRRGTLLAIAFATTLLAGCGGAQTTAPGPGPDWRYAGSGPEGWASLSPAYALCGEGRSQSPVGLTGAQHAPAAALALDYRPDRFLVTDNGHTIEAEAEDDAGSILLGSTRYDLVEFHFHAPSEHTIAGRHFKMELQFVHRAADGRLAVVGVLIEEGGENTGLAELFADVPARGAETRVEVDPAVLVPAGAASYRYTGSLTTPPCTEGVRWIVLRDPIELSRDQILAFTHRYFGTNRPTQPLNGRMLAETG